MKLVFDIGAYDGETALHLSRFSDKVIAFEANPNLVPKLKRRFEGTNVVVDGVGLSDRIGIQDFYICDAPTLSTFSKKWINNSRYSQDNFWNVKVPIEVFTIDAAIKEYGIPDYIKIDAEGHEYEIIKGLTQLLNDTIISFEWTEENVEDANRCIAYLHDLGYKAFYIAEFDDPLLNHQIPWETVKMIRNIVPDRKEKWGMIYCKKEITPMDKKEFSMQNVYAGYINLLSRPDRRAHMEAELQKASINAERFQGLLPHEVQVVPEKVATMKNRTIGAIGCMYSQMEIMKKALREGKHALVLEDDCCFSYDIQARIRHIEKFLTTHDWDVFWLGGTYHVPGQWHNAGHDNPEINNLCDCAWDVDAQPTDDPKIVRTFGAFSTYAYIVNFERIPHILQLLEEIMSISIGIDWSFIKLQPRLHTYAYVPGCVKQYDNPSNIGQGITEFSHFATLGPHWFKEKEEGFDYEQFHNKLNNQHLFDRNGNLLPIKHRTDLGVLLHENQLKGNVVELGVAEGLFSREIAERFPYEKLYLVDIWESVPEQKGDASSPQEWHDTNYEAAKERLVSFGDKVVFLKGDTSTMAKEVPDESCSLVYIDADHSYYGVMKDIVAWYPKIIKDGIMAFHDYFSQAYGVKQAVEEFCAQHRYEIIIIPEHKEEDAGAYFIKK